MPRPGRNYDYNPTIFKENTMVLEMGFIISENKFRDACQERGWYKDSPITDYNEALDLAQRYLTLNHLVQLAVHVAQHSSEKDIPTILTFIVNNCCVFTASELRPISNFNKEE